MKKDGIVDKNRQDDFRFFFGNLMNKNMIDQVGGEMNQFND